MRSRTIREGSVGLLILLGVGLFGLMILWLRNLNPGNRSYQVIVEFPGVGGMQVGAPVRFRGVTVGKITSIQPGTNQVDVEMEISPATLTIPRNSVIQANQSGLVGEISVDIFPREAALPPIDTTPLAADCPGSLILCDGDRIAGEPGVSFTELIEATIQLSDLLNDPEFFDEIKELTRNSSNAAAGVTELTGEVTRLTRSVERQLSTLSSSANTTTQAIGETATAIEETAAQFGITASQVNGLLADNRTALNSTLSNINQTTDTLRQSIVRLDPILQQAEQSEFIRNLDVLSANAVEASVNLRDASLGFSNLTSSLGTAENLLLLQQTLESARGTFQNAQKITADLDELTGDPAFRRNIRELIDGLNNLVSLTDELEQQTEVAEVLSPIAIALNPEIESSVRPEQPMDQAPTSPTTPHRSVRFRRYSLVNPRPFAPSDAPDQPINEANEDSY